VISLSTEDRRIRVRGLTRAFGAKVALHPTDVEIGPGGITGLLGPNGSGKSTFLRMLTGLVPADDGEVEVAGVLLRGDGTRIRRCTAYSPGELHFYGELRARAHVEWLLRERGREAVARALDICGALGLPLDSRVRAYSHGMKRQMLFAATLAPRVPVRILDEPTDGLDPTKRAQVLDLLEEDARTGTTILLSSHHLGEVDRACDRLLFLNEGRLVADESAEEVRNRSRRSVRISWPDGVDLDSIERALGLPGVERTTRNGSDILCLLSQPDPRPFLAGFATLGLPAPSRFEHGRLSLTELYREIYGLEGC
jgi:ABC-type multidrug transport system ATPase subunit